MSVEDIDINAAMDRAQAATIMAEPFTYLRVRLRRDGDQWCALYGDNLEDGVAGFGASPNEAQMAFNRAWYEKLKASAPNGKPEPMKKLANLAMRWAVARTEKNRLQAERNSLHCDHESQGTGGDPPCWKHWQQEHGDDPTEADMDEYEWCDDCRKRQAVHEKYVKIRSKSGALLVALLLMGRKLAAELEGK